MVSALVTGSSGSGLSPSRGHCVVFLGRTLYTLTVPLSIQVEKWVLANFNAGGGVILRWTSIPPRESRNNPSRFMLQKLG